MAGSPCRPSSFGQAQNNIAGREERFAIGDGELGDGLREPGSFRVFRRRENLDATARERDERLAPIRRVGFALAPFTFERREPPGVFDVAIDIRYCGICHSDIQAAHDGWGRSNFPLVPGHKITGIVRSIGAKVTTFAPGDHVGVGSSLTAREVNGRERDGMPTFGGYSERISSTKTTSCAFPESLPLDAAAPLLCANAARRRPVSHNRFRRGAVAAGAVAPVAIIVA